MLGPYTRLHIEKKCVIMILPGVTGGERGRVGVVTGTAERIMKQ